MIGFSDSMIFLMALPNILGLYLMAGVVEREIYGYRRRLENGELPTMAERRP